MKLYWIVIFFLLLLQISVIVLYEKFQQSIKICHTFGWRKVHVFLNYISFNMTWIIITDIWQVLPFFHYITFITILFMFYFQSMETMINNKTLVIIETKVEAEEEVVSDEVEVVVEENSTNNDLYYNYISGILFLYFKC